MAKILNLPPPSWPPQRHLRGFLVTNGPSGPMICNLPARHAKAHDFLSNPGSVPPWERTYISNKHFHKWVSNNWQTLLSNAQRTAWEVLAATVTIRQYNGTVIVPNGFQLYQWFETTWRPAWYRPGLPFLPDVSTPDTWPYTPWTPPTTPFNPTNINPAQDSMSFNFQSTPAIMLASAHCTGARVNAPGRQPPTRSYLWLNAGAVSVWPHTGLYLGSITWDGVWPIPPRPGIYTFRFRILPWDGTYTPSDWLSFNLDL